MQKRRIRISQNSITFKRHAWLMYVSAIFVCISVLFIQSLVKDGNDIFFELISLKVPFIYGIDDLEKLDTSNSQAKNDSSSENKLLIELLGKSEIKSLSVKNSLAPTILIYHTHATEAYTPTDGYEYKKTTAWRTDNNDRNIVAVGEKLCTLLSEKYGFTVIHDTTNHEPPKLSSAYSRSVVTMEEYKEKYPSINVFIDVHRDAYGKDEGGMEDVAIINGEECARLMFVVGTGEGATGSGFDEMPDFDSNYALAEQITACLNNINSNLTRKIRVKTGRYNQHISNQCLLVEVGHNANSLEQALNSVDHLAAAIAQSLTQQTVKQLDFSA